VAGEEGEDRGERGDGRGETAAAGGAVGLDLSRLLHSSHCAVDVANVSRAELESNYGRSTGTRILESLIPNVIYYTIAHTTVYPAHCKRLLAVISASSVALTQSTGPDAFAQIPPPPAFVYSDSFVEFETQFFKMEKDASQVHSVGGKDAAGPFACASSCGIVHPRFVRRKVFQMCSIGELQLK
jgi:hypothetical protein